MYNRTGEFNDVSKAFKRKPTLENYLALRRAHPDETIEVAVFGGIDPLFALEDELEKYGIAAHPLMTGVMDAACSSWNASSQRGA